MHNHFDASEMFEAWQSAAEEIESWQSAAKDAGIHSPYHLRGVIARLSDKTTTNERLEAIAHALRGSGLPDLANAQAGDENLPVLVSALTGAYQQAIAQERAQQPTPDLRHQIGGDHYANLAVQPWDVMRATFSTEEFNGFLRGNIIKYVMRDKGNRLEDLKKAQHYIDVLISEMESAP
jgi:hypothetical protein